MLFLSAAIVHNCTIPFRTGQALKCAFLKKNCRHFVGRVSTKERKRREFCTTWYDPGQKKIPAKCPGSLLFFGADERTRTAGLLITSDMMGLTNSDTYKTLSMVCRHPRASRFNQRVAHHGTPMGLTAYPSLVLVPHWTPLYSAGSHGNPYDPEPLVRIGG